MSPRAARLVRTAGAAVLLGLVGWWMAAPYARSAALLADLTRADTWWRRALPVRLQPIQHEDLEVPTRHGAFAARVYRPARSRLSLIVFPGVHAGGLDEPRLVALARRIAQSGALVLTAPLPDLRAYRISPGATDMIEDATRWMSEQPALAPEGRVGLVGVSFAGGLAIVAAGRPALEDRLTAIFGLGVHADLPRVLRYLTGADAPGAPGPPHDYGLVLMLRSALPAVVPPDQRPGLDAALVRFLDASSATSTDQALAERLFAEAREMATALPEPSSALMRAVIDRDIAALGRQLAPLAEAIGGDPALSPVRSPLPTAPVFLLHGEMDNVIPSSESLALARALDARGRGETAVLLTPLITHADALPHASAGDLWRLLRFWTGLWRALSP